ncbi:MAG: FeoA domain-containing protein [Lachnospiraceae bacterium]|nr:FeoA domain-containing protein [Lachnospiraceae bacterium]
MTLRDLEIGKSARITAVGGGGALRQHFLDMGMIPGEKITLVKYAPMGDPMELRIHDYELTLRLEDAEKIQIQTCGGGEDEPWEEGNASDVEAALKKNKKKQKNHPGLGEETVASHDYKSQHKGGLKGKLTFALVGNQNCGKTTLFNQLTGANQHVGRKTVCSSDGNFSVCCGIYSSRRRLYHRLCTWNALVFLLYLASLCGIYRKGE